MHFGEYDECLDVALTSESETVLRGQYCSLEFKPPTFFDFPPEHRRELHNGSLLPALAASKTALSRLARYQFGLHFMAFYAGVCTPSTCTARDIQELATAVAKQTQFSARVVSCETKDEKVVWSSDQVLVVCILALCALLCVLGTGLAWLYPVDSKQNASVFRIGVNSFSVSRNSFQLFGPKENLESNTEDKLHFLCGIRVIALFALVFGFTLGFPYLIVWHKLAHKAGHLQVRRNFWLGFFGNATLPFDTLLYTSGLLFGYKVFRLSSTQKSKLIPLKLLVKVVIRCLCCNVLAIGLFLILPLLGDGPLWLQLVGQNVQVCRDTAWRNFLFIQNYWPFEENCMFHTTLMSMIVFCAVVGLPVVWILLNGHTRLGLLAAGLTILASCVSSGMVNAINRFPPAIALPVINSHTLFDMFSLDLIRPYTHLTSYTVGLLAGWALSQDIILKKTSLKTLAVLAILGGMIVIFYIPFNFPYEGNTYRIMAALYASSYRTIWCLCLAAFSIFCYQGGAGVLNSFMSWSFFVKLDELTWQAYLLFPLVAFYYHGQSRTLIYLGVTEMLLHCFGFMAMSYFGACLIHMLFTAPARNLSCLVGRLLLRRNTLRLAK